MSRSDRISEGYTMTREDGWFDFMVNGGGAVTLQFGKSPFPPRIETLFAPWNEVNREIRTKAFKSRLLFAICNRFRSS